MPTLQEIRQQYPQYSDLSDEQLAKGLHDKYYADMPFDKFSQKIGYAPAAPSAPAQKPKSSLPLLPGLSPTDYFRDLALPAVSAGLAAIPSGLAGLAALPRGGVDQAVGVMSKVQNALTYKPKSQLGELATQAAAYPTNLLAKGADAAGTAVLEKTKSPLAATATNTAIQSIPMVVGGVLSRRARVPEAEPAPTTEQLLQKGSEAYKAAEDAGVSIKPGVLDNSIQELSSRLTKEGLDQTLHPKATRALERLSELQGKPATLNDLEVRRRIASDVANSSDRAERRIGGQIVEKIDDTMENLKPEDVSSGDAAAGVSALNEARGLWKRARKGEVIDDLIHRAGTRAGQYSGSGFENAIRTEFRQLAMNKKRLRGFSSEEVAAIEEVARGGPVSNAMRFLGKFSIRGPVSAGVNMGAGAIGGPAASAALEGLGELGRFASGAATQRKALAVGDLVRRGGSLPPPQLPPIGAQDLAAAAGYGGVQASQDELWRRLVEQTLSNGTYGQ